MTALFSQLSETTSAVRTRLGGREPTVGLVLGSGLGAYADELSDAVAVPYREIPHFPVSGVVGHAGRLVVGRRAGVCCAAMQGRAHYYEGHDLERVTFPIRALIRLGVKTLVITNAAGGVSPKHPPGTLVVIRDHLNLIPGSPLRGENDERLGPRFPDLSEAYPPALRALAARAGRSIGLELPEGVYAGLPGPAYETPAEIRMLSILGADLCGMSTVPEVVVANHMGARVLGLSCVTNLAAGISPRKLSHEEVTETAARVRSTFASLLDAILAELAKEASS
jgi:purine-nucleoside phosphorylase